MAERDDTNTLSSQEALTAQETLVEKSERMEREHSARREVKKREERVRRIQSEQGRSKSDGNAARRLPPARPPARAPLTGKRGSRPDATQVSPPPAASLAHRSAEARSFPDDELQPASAPPAKRSPPPKSPTPASGQRPVRISDPFPPIRKKSAEHPGGASTSPPSSSRGGASAQSTGSKVESSFDLLAVELEIMIIAVRTGWRDFSFGDRVTWIAALFVTAGVLMPWVTTPTARLQIGLNVGGLIHFAFSVAAVGLTLQAARRRRSNTRVMASTRVMALSTRALDDANRRTSLYIVLLGFTSTVFTVYLFVVYGLAKSSTWPVTFHFGLYWTMAMTTGLSYGGFARFRG